MNFFREFRTETKIFLIVASVSAVLAVTGIFLLQAGLGPSSPTSSSTPPPAAAPVPSPQPQMPDTAGWQTYRSEEFGFELKYPEEWITEASGPNYVQEQIERGEVISGTVAPTLETLSFFSPAWQAHPRLQFSFTVSESAQEISVENYESLSFSSSCDPRFLDERPNNVALVMNDFGVEFLEVKVVKMAKDKYYEDTYFSCYYSKNHRGNKLTFEIASWEGRLNFENAEKEMKTILATFRFVQ